MTDFARESARKSAKWIGRKRTLKAQRTGARALRDAHRKPASIAYSLDGFYYYQEMKNPKVDAFFGKAEKWRKEMEKLRRIVLECQLTEEIKWGQPCYTFQDRNVILIHGFKEYCALLFFKGVLLRDPKGILIQQTENVQAARQVRFTNVREIIDLGPVLKAYISEAIEVEKAGLKVQYKTESKPVPHELRQKLEENTALKRAFNALTPGRQRAYIFYFSAAKQSATRATRIEKCRQRILHGKGLTDCICGRSKNPPACDGSHKYKV